MAQNIHYYSNIQERKYSDEILDQIKNKTQQNNSKFYNSKSDIKELFRSWTPFSFFFFCLQDISISGTGFTHCYQLSWADIPLLILSLSPSGLQYNPDFASYLLAMAFLGFLVGTLHIHAKIGSCLETH